MSEPLQLWTVYEHPADYPLSYVARMFEADAAGGARPTPHVYVEPTLDALRARMMRMGLTCLTRAPADDPRIVETWI